jgi:hypothetical protein
VEIETLPGGDLVGRGLDDLGAGRETIESLLVEIGAPRLRSLGFEVPRAVRGSPEHRLYDLLAARHGDAAHAGYPALLSRLVSFERAAACVRSSTASGSAQ